jgi:hypothetical protein
MATSSFLAKPPRATAIVTKFDTTPEDTKHEAADH